MTNIAKYGRRDLLKSGLGAAALTAVPGLAQAGPQATGNMHLSLAAYSVREQLSRGEMDLFQFIDWCAEMDLEGTELTSYYFRENFDRSYLHALKRRAFRSGVTISGTAVRNDFCQPPGPKRSQEVAHVKAWVDHAVELFAPHIRIFAGNVPQGADKKAAIQWVADAIREVLDHAEKRGIVIGLENHGGITARAADVLAICEAVGDHPWFGVNLDTGNFRTNPYQELAMVAPRAVNVQVKVHIAGPDGSRIESDFERLRRILVEAKYKGWVVLEYEADDPKREVPVYLKKLKELFRS